MIALMGAPGDGQVSQQGGGFIGHEGGQRCALVGNRQSTKKMNLQFMGHKPFQQMISK